MEIVKLFIGLLMCGVCSVVGGGLLAYFIVSILDDVFK